MSSAGLERHVATDENQHEGPFRRNRPVRRTISTLDPQKLVRSDFLDLSGRAMPSVIPNVLPSFQIAFKGARSGRHIRHIRFPPNTRGFLYYRSPPDSAPLAGEIRFCLVEGPGDPAGFSQGSDSALPSGLPWHINVAFVDQYLTLAGLCAQLLSENLMNPSLFRKCRGKVTLHTRGFILHSLGQPFTLTFGESPLCVSRGENIGLARLRFFFG